MTTKSCILVLGLLALAPAASSSAELPVCQPTLVTTPDGEYPDSSMSPNESLAAHDTVFLGEVLVPAKRCSLGYCAGLKVVRTLKGEPGTQTLVRVARAANDRCAPSLFTKRGDRWMVFAQGGTSRKGHRYLEVADDGPTFAARQLPDFHALEGRYRMLRARLDAAIDTRLGTGSSPRL